MMTWEEAKAQIEKHIVPGLQLEDGQQYRYVTEVETSPEWACWVRVGQITRAKVTMGMLEDIFKNTVKEGGIYNRFTVPRQHRQKIEAEGTYVHVIGGIFHKAGISGPRESRKYRFL